jgi:hypothetical protein
MNEVVGQFAAEIFSVPLLALRRWQALQHAPTRTVLPIVEWLPAPLLPAAFPSLRSEQT